MFWILAACMAADESGESGGGAVTVPAAGPRYVVRDFVCDGQNGREPEGDWSALPAETPIMVQALQIADDFGNPIAYVITDAVNDADGFHPGSAPNLGIQCQREMYHAYRLTLVYAE